MSPRVESLYSAARKRVETQERVANDRAEADRAIRAYIGEHAGRRKTDRAAALVEALSDALGDDPAKPAMFGKASRIEVQDSRAACAERRWKAVTE